MKDFFMHNKSKNSSMIKKCVLGGCHGRFFNFTYTQLLIINVILIYAFMNGRWRTSHKFTLEKQKKKTFPLLQFTATLQYFIFTLCFFLSLSLSLSFRDSSNFHLTAINAIVDKIVVWWLRNWKRKLLVHCLGISVRPRFIFFFYKKHV